MYSYLVSRTTNLAAPDVADADFFHSWRGGEPTILYNITAYGLYSLFVEIQTKVRFPINFTWEIFEAWVRMYLTQVKFWSRKKVWIFFQK